MRIFAYRLALNACKSVLDCCGDAKDWSGSTRTMVRQARAALEAAGELGRRYPEPEINRNGDAWVMHYHCPDCGLLMVTELTGRRSNATLEAQLVIEGRLPCQSCERASRAEAVAS